MFPLLVESLDGRGFFVPPRSSATIRQNTLGQMCPAFFSFLCPLCKTSTPGSNPGGASTFLAKTPEI
jgi:hypothetical protein